LFANRRFSQCRPTRALELSTQLCQSGLADFLHVQDSERSLYAAQDALVQSNQIVSQDLVQLYKAIGGGWQDGKEIL
jgi:outer membrane protein TolC